MDRLSPVLIFLSEALSLASSSSPRTREKRARLLSAAFMPPFNDRSPYAISTATPRPRSCSASVTESVLDAGVIGTIKRSSARVSGRAIPSASQAKTQRSTPIPNPIPERSPHRVLPSSRRSDHRHRSRIVLRDHDGQIQKRYRCNSPSLGPCGYLL